MTPLIGCKWGYRKIGEFSSTNGQLFFFPIAKIITNVIYQINQCTKNTTLKNIHFI
jgi:hypothetical protein